MTSAWGPIENSPRLHDADAGKGLVVDLRQALVMARVIEARQARRAHVADEAVEGELEGLTMLRQGAQELLLSSSPGRET